MNVIKQIVNGSGDSQTIKMVVKDNERGPQGEKGETGTAATITAGNAYTVPNGAQPAVMNTGSSSAAVFDFYIPKGDKGDKGDQGDPGVVQYTAGPGIKIKNNVISVVGGGGGGGGAGIWGDIIGDIEDQTDLQEEFAKYSPTTDFADVAFSGAYADLSGTPSIPAAQVQSDWNQTSDSAVDYIKNKPTIPTVNNATLTIQQNGTNVATFTANSATNATANITSPVITMSNTDPGEGSSLAENNYLAVYGGDSIILDYSLNETNTGIKWIDGSAIYKKTISLGNLPNNTTKTVAHGISNFGVLVNLEGHFTNGTNTGPLPYSATTLAKNVQIYADATNITIGTGEDRSAYSGYATLYYTKSS